MDISDAKEINYKEGLMRFSNNEAMYRKYLFKYAMDTSFENALLAKQNNNKEELFKAMHTLKGTSGNLSMNLLYIACEQYVNAFRAGKIEQLDALFEAIAVEHNKILNVLKESHNI